MEFLVIAVIMLALGLAWLGLRVFFRFLKKKNQEFVGKRNQEEKEFLDQFEVACKALPMFSGAQFPEPLMIRSNDYHLKIVEKNVDEAKAVMTPYVVVQFNQQSRQFELRLYIIDFLRSGETVTHLVKKESFPSDWIERVVIEALRLFSNPFRDK